MSNAVFIPKDSTKPLENVDLDLDDLPLLLRQTVGDDSYLEQVRTQALFDLSRANRVTAPDEMVVMLVDEAGAIKGLPINPRASIFYPGGLIHGDAWLVLSRRDPMEGDEWVSLPEGADWAIAASDYIIDAVLRS